jgi:hypothetical protein
VPLIGSGKKRHDSLGLARPGDGAFGLSSGRQLITLDGEVGDILDRWAEEMPGHGRQGGLAGRSPR